MANFDKLKARPGSILKARARARKNRACSTSQDGVGRLEKSLNIESKNRIHPQLNL